MGAALALHPPIAVVDEDVVVVALTPTPVPRLLPTAVARGAVQEAAAAAGSAISHHQERLWRGPRADHRCRKRANGSRVPVARAVPVRWGTVLSDVKVDRHLPNVDPGGADPVTKGLHRKSSKSIAHRLQTRSAVFLPRAVKAPINLRQRQNDSAVLQVLSTAAGNHDQSLDHAVPGVAAPLVDVMVVSPAATIAADRNKDRRARDPRRPLRVRDNSK